MGILVWKNFLPFGLVRGRPYKTSAVC